MNRIQLVFKALQELGPGLLLLYARYQAGLRTGWYRRQTGKPPRVTSGLVRTNLLQPPTNIKLSSTLGQSAAALLSEADEIVDGRIRLFGGEPQSMHLEAPGPLQHWTRCQERSPQMDTGAPAQDIKFTWELARFGWACTLGRAYRLSGDERYAAAFWGHLEAFLDANPPYLGPHWLSAQEAALRLIALVFAAQVFAGSEQATLKRLQRLAQAVGDHAARIPPTLVYALAQNNNHLLSEATGLITAALALPEDPRAGDWQRLGWRWFRQGLLGQVAPDGEYCQHSTNYHRLVLQLGLWLAAINPEALPAECSARLAWMTGWLAEIVDPQSGQAPNLGPNDGAYILPLTMSPFEDYRPVLQAAQAAFTGQSSLPAGSLDEMGLWLAPRHHPNPTDWPKRRNTGPLVLRSPDGQSWATLRSTIYSSVTDSQTPTSRPGHADQLHLDLWWRGLNLAGDAGTYLYNAPPPWDNALTGTALHNTITVNGLDQMTRAGRFLYLDWAQARLIESQAGEDHNLQRVAARHDGYHRLGLAHLRLVDCGQAGRWLIEDLLMRSDAALARQKAPFQLRLHWLLPDWPWELQGTHLSLESPYGRVELRIESDPAILSGLDGPYPTAALVRAGVLLRGSTPVVPPTWGWRSLTYGVKIPALSFAVTIEAPAPLSITSEWILPV
jgi:hypothetical protein